MGLMCGCDLEYYVELSDELVTSVGTEMCIECGKLIHVGVPHYFVREWNYNEDGDEYDMGQHRCCEECGDLALSVLEKGFCWTYRELRGDIADMNVRRNK